jgi:hypothetical protein
MDNQLGTFLKAANAAACSWFNTYGGALENIGIAVSISDLPLSPQIGAGLLLANAAAQTNCNYDPSLNPGQSPVDGCIEVSGGYGILQTKFDGVDWRQTTIQGIQKFCSIDSISQEPRLFNGGWVFDITATGDLQGEPSGGCTRTVTTTIATGLSEALARTSEFRLSVVEGSCQRESDGTPDAPIVSPYTYTDPDNNCVLTVELLGYAEGPGGSIFQVTQMDPDVLRGSGGVIGGCNFDSTIVINQFGGGDGGSQPPTTFPNPDNPPSNPNPNEPWWVPYVAAALGGVVAGVTEDILSRFFARTYPGLIYRMVSVCEKNAAGEPISESVDVPIPQLTAPDAQLARLDAIVELLQAAKNFKQPVCPPDRPALLGDWVTVRFESIENSPQGTRPLRKLFRYRSQSALDLGQIATYWENFTWNAGPVCVQHKNASWGTPQCWADSVDEGKRVIRFAGLEAGIDPDAVGEWVISGSSDPRFGMPGTMHVAKVEGLDWVTSRQGPSGLPLLTVDP